MQSLLQDIRYGVRMLTKNASFTAIAVLTLALGIGANTAIFSVVNAELLRPLPFHDPGRLVRVGMTNSRTGWKGGAVDYPDFEDWRSQNQVFEKMAAYDENHFTLTGVASPAHLNGTTVSADMFALLGATPELGRTFLPEEDEPNHYVVVLDHEFWKQQFGGDPQIIGRVITLDNRAYTVVGVMPAGFEFPLQRQSSSVWITFSADQFTDDNTPPITKERGAHFMNVIARLKPGVSVTQAQAAMDVISSGLAKQYPDTDKYFGAQVMSEQDRLTRSIRPALLMLMVAVGLVLLIACVNVANLLQARATTRGREIAIRAALGAGRKRVVRQLLTESFLLAGVAGVLGVMIAAWGSALLVRLSPQDLPRAGEIHTDGWVLAFTVGISLLTAACLRTCASDTDHAREFGGRAQRGIAEFNRRKPSDTIPTTSLIDSTISLSAVPAWLTSSTPSRTWPLLLVMSPLMSLAACAERCARARTSDATTAKPRPASPARAASTAALSASRFVCRAISSITPIMSEILPEEDSICAMASTALATTWRPRSATPRVVPADSLACWALSAFFFTVAEICSIEAEVSSRLAACSSVRCDRSIVLVDISADALATSRATNFTSRMKSANVSHKPRPRFIAAIS